MATESSQSSSKAGEFRIDTREHGYSDGPPQVLVELSPVDRGTHMAILAAGADGRYSFDFRITSGGLQIKKAFIEGMRVRVEELPDWIDPIVERIEEELGVGA